jgi:adenylate kinase
MEKTFNIVLIGPPGAGKGTLAQEIEAQTPMSVLTTSNALRAEVKTGSALGNEISDLMAKGKFVADEVIFKVVEESMQSDQYNEGVVFDGFPRTLAQAEFFSKNNIQIDILVLLEIEDDVIIDRMQGRRVHLPSGRVYHVNNRPPKQEGLDDVTGEALSIREDDRAEVVKSRLEDYHHLTKPIIAWAEKQYQNGLVDNIIKIDAAQDFDAVWRSFVMQVSALTDE